jgi:hypothetical protein
LEILRKPIFPKPNAQTNTQKQRQDFESSIKMMSQKSFEPIVKQRNGIFLTFLTSREK